MEKPIGSGICVITHRYCPNYIYVKCGTNKYSGADILVEPESY